MERRSQKSVACFGLVLSALSGGCAPSARPIESAQPTWQPLAPSEVLPTLQGSTPGPVDQTRHHVGEVLVHRFSGTYRNHPLTLRQEVVAVDSSTFTVLYTLDEGATEQQLLVVRAQRSERIVKVERQLEGRTIPGTEADYDALVEKTMFIPDVNHGEVAKKSETCLVDQMEHDCEIAEYRVQVADQTARMSVARSKSLGRDVSGEIIAVDGTVLYHAQLLQAEQVGDRDYNHEVALISSPE
jgi:hypothetical protein